MDINVQCLGCKHRTINWVLEDLTWFSKQLPSKNFSRRSLNSLPQTSITEMNRGSFDFQPGSLKPSCKGCHGDQQNWWQMLQQAQDVCIRLERSWEQVGWPCAVTCSSISFLQFLHLPQLAADFQLAVTFTSTFGKQLAFRDSCHLNSWVAMSFNTFGYLWDPLGQIMLWCYHYPAIWFPPGRWKQSPSQQSSKRCKAAGCKAKGQAQKKKTPGPSTGQWVQHGV